MGSKKIASIISIVLFVIGLYAITAHAEQAIIRSGQFRQQQTSLPRLSRPLHKLTVNGTERTYLLYVPKSYQPSKAMPLIIALHGGMGNAYINERMTQLAPLAEQKGFILVNPNGTGPLSDRALTWNAGNCCGYALEHHTDDIAFIKDMIDDVSKQYHIDPKRIYVTGMSNGAKMSYRLACELSDKIAAIAPVAGSLDTPQCKPTSPISVIAFHGTADQHILYNGDAPIINIDRRHPRVDHSVADSIAFWVKHNQCQITPAKTQKGNIIKEVYTGCKQGSEVTLYSIIGGGHTWPGGQMIRMGGDPPTSEISASALMVDFFLHHPKVK